MLNKSREMDQSPSSPNFKKSLFKATSALLVSILILFFISSTPKQQHSLASRRLTVDQQIEQQRKQYISDATNLFAQHPEYKDLALTVSNFYFGDSTSQEVKKRQIEETKRLDQMYQFGRFPNEAPFCLLVQELPWEDSFSYEFVLNSIFNQNYTNYRVIIIHEPARDQQFQLVQQYLQTRKIPRERALNVLNAIPKGLLKNIYAASQQYCSPSSISINLVGGAQLIGRNVLRVFNALYQANPVALVYSNYYRYNPGRFVRLGINKKYRENEMARVRSLAFHLSTAFTYRSDILQGIPQDQFTSIKGNSLDGVYEQALLFPLGERTGGASVMAEGYHFLAIEHSNNYSHYLKAINARKSATNELRARNATERNNTYFEQTRGQVIVSSFSQRHLIDQPELNSISTTVRQSSTKFTSNTPIFSLANDYLATRAGDRYIYQGNMEIIQEKWAYELSRIDSVYLMEKKHGNQLLKYNLFLGDGVDDKQEEIEKREEERLGNEHQFNQYNNFELPFCIVVSDLPSSSIPFRFEYLLNSIFSQKYSNFFVVINNRDPALDKYVRKYLHFYHIDPQHYVYRFSTDHTSSPLEATSASLRQHCSPSAVALVLDGRSELLSRNVLRVLNAEHQRNSKAIIYSATADYQGKTFDVVDIAEFTQANVEKNDYRAVENPPDYFFTFRATLFQSVDEVDLKNSKGKYYSSNFEEALFYPLLELACGSIKKIPGVFNIRNKDLNESSGSRSVEWARNQLRGKIKYPCYSEKEGVNGETAVLTTISSLRVQAGGIVVSSGKRTVHDLLSLSQRGEKIEQYLYSSEVIAQRKRYQQERAATQGDSELGKRLAAYNLLINHQLDQPLARDVGRDQEAAVASYQGGTKEHPICVVVDKLSFTSQFHFEFLLNSIFQQDYTNYFAVIFGDSDDSNDLLVRKYLHFYRISTENYVFLSKASQRSSLENLLTATQKYCARDALMVWLRGSDELIGRSVFKRLNWAYTTQQQPLLITSDYFLAQEGRIGTIFVADYASKVQENPIINYRKGGAMPRFASFPANLLIKIDTSNFKNEKGQFFQVAVQRALFTPLLQMACSRVKRLDTVSFLVRREGTSAPIIYQKQAQEEGAIFGKAPFGCLSS